MQTHNNQDMVLYSLLYWKQTRKRIIATVDSDDFTYPNNEIFEELLKAINNKTIDDFDYQQNFIVRNSNLQNVRGTEWEKSLNEMVNNSVRRKLNGQLMVSSALINNPLSSIKEISESLQEIHYISKDSRLYNKSIRNSKDLMISTMDKLQRIQNGEEVYNIWGIDEIDEIAPTGSGDLNIIAARTGIGKSIIAHNCILNASNKQKTGYWCAEMAEDMIGMRMISAHSNVPLEAIKNGNLSQFQLKDIMGSTNHINSLKDNLFISTGENEKGDKVEDLIIWIEKLVKTHDVKNVFLDYLQRIQPTNNRLTRRDQVMHIVHSLKTCAQGLGITITALAQLNRSAAGERPAIHHLAECGFIEQEASIIVLADRIDMGEDAKARRYKARKPGYDQDFIDLDNNQLKGKIVFIIAKNRNGPKTILYNDIDMATLKVGLKANFYEY